MTTQEHILQLEAALAKQNSLYELEVDAVLMKQAELCVYEKQANVLHSRCKERLKAIAALRNELRKVTA